MVLSWGYYFLVVSKSNQKRMRIEGTIIDVRSYAEYLGAHVASSINIPIQEIPNRLDEIRQFAQPIILCCASGIRSAQAAWFLQNQGIECSDGGSWMDVNATI